MKKLILAIDEIQNLDEVVALVKKVGHLVYAVKIHNLYDKSGPDIVRVLKEAGAEKVWVDFKLYDIPNTGKLRAESIAADIISVHASGGLKMMKEIVSSGKEVFAVTMLTSFSPSEVKQIYNREVDDVVLVLTRLAQEAGVSGVVCSPKEITMLRGDNSFKDLKLVVPGVRSSGVDLNDQNRVGTPTQALLDGADYLVVGRQITQAQNPEEEAKKLCEEIRNYKNL
ncbi:orotidine-5'-phosphate decarboxylase [Candidatus Nomurabacteria bacterium]|nr:orotidine-5'-phosphate decarboxylase [Candidatus Nomurabacteria bacterium]